MVYDKTLASRVSDVLHRRRGFVEKKMFGGIGHLLHGNMCVGVWKDFLIVRVGIDQYEQLLKEPFTKEFDITGKVMRGWVMVDMPGVDGDEQLREWIERAAKFVRTLPPK